MDYVELLSQRYLSAFGEFVERRSWKKGPVDSWGPDFFVGIYRAEDHWVYATCGMSSHQSARVVELHLLVRERDDCHVELLTVIAHYYRSGHCLGPGHTVNFGRPLIPGSRLTHGFLSSPYLYGDQLSNVAISEIEVHCLWLIPITAAEREFKAANGIEAIEIAFEKADLNYLDPQRRSVV